MTTDNPGLGRQPLRGRPWRERRARIQELELGSAEVQIRHGMPRPPEVRITPQANVACWQSRPADRDFVYLKAAAKVRATVVLEVI